jgi:hypothetical protein
MNKTNTTKNVDHADRIASAIDDFFVECAERIIAKDRNMNINERTLIMFVRLKDIEDEIWDDTIDTEIDEDEALVKCARALDMLPRTGRAVIPRFRLYDKIAVRAAKFFFDTSIKRLKVYFDSKRFAS